MEDNKDNIISKDKNIPPIVYEILNVAYHEFKQMYGDKHSKHIKLLIESITDKVKKSVHYYFGANATANAELGIRYTESKQLPAILKHEMWHVYNNAASDLKKSLRYIPLKYIDKLQQNGYIEKKYNERIEYLKERWKDDPERLEESVKDFDTFKNNDFDFGTSQIEMWTEWFNSQTHLKENKENFWNWKNGYFTKSLSSGSFYDAYINIASIISCIIPKDRLLEMYLQTEEYQTDYSYPEMIEDFDERYANSLDSEESEKYEYPYLKIVIDIIKVSDNARKNPSIALEALQSAMKTCFNAYLQKLEGIEHIDYNQAKDIYSEIKYMQEHMVWNLDKSNLQELDYIQAMNRIQDKFKNMLRELGLENQEVMQMFENVDYTAENPFAYIEDGDKIAKKMLKTEKESKTHLIDIDGNYKVNVGESGIKDNLYSNLFVLLGEKKFNMLYKGFQDDYLNNNSENILLKFHKQIENAETNEDFISIYNSIYDLYAKKLEDTLNVNENIESEFNRYSMEIVELQRNGLFDERNRRYIPKLEHIIDIYNKRVQAYENEIDKVTESDVQTFLEQGHSREKAEKFASRIPNIYKKELDEQHSRIELQREKQVLQYLKTEKTPYTISTQQIRKNNNRCFNIR